MVRPTQFYPQLLRLLIIIPLTLALLAAQPTQATDLTTNNLLTNSSFEEGDFAPGNAPTGWSKAQYDPTRGRFTWDNTQAHSGSKSVKVSATEPDDARWLQVVTVQPNTYYQLAGWVRTENVRSDQAIGIGGANLSVESNTDPFLGRSQKLVGTNDWSYVGVIFNSGDTTQVTVAARLGDYGGTSTGAAWFDALHLQIYMAPPIIVESGYLTGDADRESDGFGYATALSNDLLVVGAPYSTENNVGMQGAVYLFAPSQPGRVPWARVAKLTVSSLPAQSQFGAAIGLSGTTLAVGAPYVPVDGKANHGAVYIFARNTTNLNQWDLRQTLTATDGVAEDRFGQVLAIDGTQLIIGAAGKAYIFSEQSGGQWRQTQKLTTADPQNAPRLGEAVAIQAGWAIVGATGQEIGGVTPGAAYLFAQNQGGSNNWGQVKKFTPPETPTPGPVHRTFGSAVFLLDEQAFVGDPNWREVYIYGRNQGGADNWGQVQLLIPDAPITFASRDFGSRLTSNGDQLLVGLSQGLHLFARQADLWQPHRKLTLADFYCCGFGFAGGLAANERWAAVSIDTIVDPDRVYLFDHTRSPAPLISFAQAEYTVNEGAGVAKIAITLDQPNPYPALSIEYVTKPGDATTPEDYTPVTGTVTLPQNVISATFDVPITNDNLLERTESLNLELSKPIDALLNQERRFARLTITDGDQAACDFQAGDEASWDRALRCANVAGSGVHTITVTANISFTQPAIKLFNPEADRIVIMGNGHTIDAQGHGRVFMQDQTKVAINDLTLRGGRLAKIDDWRVPYYGGGIYAITPNIGFATEPSCALTLTNVILTDNEAYAGGGIYYGCELPLTMVNTTVSNNRAVFGGAFSTAGGEEFFTRVFVNGSTFSDNTADESGGAFDLAIGDGGVILQLVNSTVSGNQAITGTGGGLFLNQSAIDGASEATLINSTVANNTAREGSGVYNRYGSLFMSNSLIADNRGGTNCILFVSEDGNGRIVSNGYNLDSDGTCLPEGVGQPSDLPNGNANLGPLADNGGPTLTHALLAESDALDAASNAVCAAAPVNGVDQRGVRRPQGPRCDIGAFEAEAAGSGNLLFVSSSSSGRAGAVTFRDEDIVAYDLASNTWQMIFDGSDLGITTDVDAFSFEESGNLLLSLNAAATVSGLGPVDDADILRFTPTRLGSETAGAFAWYLRGADVGLTTDGEDIDVIDFDETGRLVVSTIGDFQTPTVAGKDEDLIVLTAATTGNPSSGSWQMFFDGSTVGLANEDVNGLWIDPASGEHYLTVKDSFAFADQAVAANDIFVCTPTLTAGKPTCSYQLFWDGDQYSYGAKNVDALHSGALPVTFTASVQPSAEPALTPAEAQTDEDADDQDEAAGDQRLFLPVIEQ